MSSLTHEEAAATACAGPSRPSAEDDHDQVASKPLNWLDGPYSDEPDELPLSAYFDPSEFDPSEARR